MTINPTTYDKPSPLSILELPVDSHKNDDLSLPLFDVPKDRVGIFKFFLQNNWVDEKGLLTALGMQTLPNELQALAENRQTVIEKYINLETVKPSFATLLNENVEYLKNSNPQTLLDTLLGIIRLGSFHSCKKSWETYHLLLTLGYKITDEKVIEEIEHSLDLSVAQIKHSKDKIHFLLTNFQTWCDSISTLSPIQKKILLMNGAFHIQKRYAHNAHDFKLFNKIFSFPDISKESCPELIQALEKISPFFSTYYISSFLDLFGVIGALLNQETLSTQHFGNKRIYTLAVKNETGSPVYFYWEANNLSTSLDIILRIVCPSTLSPTEFTDLLFPLLNLFIRQNALRNEDAETLKELENHNSLFRSLATSPHYLIQFCGLFGLARSRPSSHETLLLEAPKFFCIFGNDSLKTLLFQCITDVYGSPPILKTPSEFCLEWGHFLMNLARHDLKFSPVLCAYLKDSHPSSSGSLFDSLPSLIDTSSSIARDLLPICKMKLDNDRYVKLLIKAFAVFKEKRNLSTVDELFRDTLILELQEFLPDALTKIPELNEDPLCIWCAEIVLSKTFVEVEKKDLTINRFEKSWKILTFLFEKLAVNNEDKFFLLMDYLTKGNSLPSFLNKNHDVAPWLHLVSLTTKTFPNQSQKEEMIALICSSIDTPKRWERFSREENNPSSEQWRAFFSILFESADNPPILEKFVTSLIKLPIYLENSLSIAKKGLEILDLSTCSEKKKYPFTYVIQSGWMDHMELQSDFFSKVLNFITLSNGEENSKSIEEKFKLGEQVFSRLHEKKLSLCPTLLSSLEEGFFKLLQSPKDTSVKLKWFEKYLAFSNDEQALSSYFKNKLLPFLIEVCDQSIVNGMQHPLTLFSHSLFKGLSVKQLTSTVVVSDKMRTVALYLRHFFFKEILEIRDEIRPKLSNNQDISPEYESRVKSLYEFFNTHKEVLFTKIRPFELLSVFTEVLAVNNMEIEVHDLWKWIKEKNIQEERLERDEGLHFHALKYFVLLVSSTEIKTNFNSLASFEEIFLSPTFQPLFTLQSSDELIRTSICAFKAVFDGLLAHKSLLESEKKSERQDTQLKSLFIHAVTLFDKYANTINHIEYVKYVEDKSGEELKKIQANLAFSLYQNVITSPPELKIDAQEKRIATIEPNYKEILLLKEDVEISIIRGLIKFNVFSDGFSRSLSFCQSLHHSDSWKNWLESYLDLLKAIEVVQKTEDTQIIHSYLKILDITFTKLCYCFEADNREFFADKHDSFLKAINLSKATPFHAAFIQHTLILLWNSRFFAKSHFPKNLFEKEFNNLQEEFYHLDLSHQQISLEATCHFIGTWRAAQHKRIPIPITTLKFLFLLGCRYIDNSFKQNSGYKPIIFTIISSFTLTEIEFLTKEFEKNYNKKDSQFYNNNELDEIIEKILNTTSKLCIYSTITNKKIKKGDEFEIFEVKSILQILQGFYSFICNIKTKDKVRGNSYAKNFKTFLEGVLTISMKDNPPLYNALTNFGKAFMIR